MIDFTHGKTGMEVPLLFEPGSLLVRAGKEGTALIIDAQGTRVAVVTAANTVHLQPLRIGRDFGAEVEIFDGLKEDEQLVNNRSDTLAEGTKVQIAPAPPAGETVRT